jgi:hypothetical protein
MLISRLLQNAELETVNTLRVVGAGIERGREIESLTNDGAEYKARNEFQRLQFDCDLAGKTSGTDFSL